MAGSMLHIDTELLKQAATVAGTANEAITQALNLINQVTEHHDWVCSKREIINNYAVENRQAINVLQNNASSFYEAVKTASDRFTEKEEELASASDKLEGIISSVIVKVPAIGGGIGSAVGSVGLTGLSDIASSISSGAASLSSNGGKHG